MLLSLLPLAGWAVDITEKAVTLSSSTTPYTGADITLPTVNAVADATGDIVSTKWYDKDGNEITTGKVKNAGTYSVKVKTNGDTGEATGTFKVTQVQVIVTANSITTGVKFGDAVPSFSVKYAGFVAADLKTGTNPNNEPAEGVMTGSVAEYLTDYEQGDDAADNYYIRPVINDLSATNYTFTLGTDGVLKVGAKSLTTSMITSVGGDKDYTAGNLFPAAASVKLRDNTVDAEHDIDATNYSYKVYASTTIFNTSTEVTSASDYDGKYNAGTYTVRITGSHNYTGTVSKTFKINKADLLITTLDGTDKFYDGTTIALDVTQGTTVSVQGLVGGQTLDAIQGGDYGTLSLSLKGTDANAINAGEYTITLKGNKSDDAMFQNYFPSYKNTGKVEIKKRTVTVKAADQHRSYNSDDDFVTGIQVTATNVEDYLEITEYAAPGTDGKGVLPAEQIATYPKVKRAEGTTAKDYDLNLVGNIAIVNAEEADVTDNYTITMKNGKFTIEKGVIRVAPNAKKITYGDSEPALDAEILGMIDDDITSAFQTAVNAALYIDGDCKNADTYSGAIKVDLTKINLDDFPMIKANYSDVIRTFKADYTVSPRVLTKIQIGDQSLNKGDGEIKLAKTKKTVEFTAQGYTLTDADYETLLSQITLGFNTADVAMAGSTKLNEQIQIESGALKSDAAEGTYAKAILIKDASLTNFKLPQQNNADIALTAEITNVYVLGKLTVSDANAELALSFANTEAANTANTTNLTAANGKKMATVTFAGDRTLAAETWGTLVLPFATSVRELSTALGYVVVDVLDQSKGDGSNVYFKLHFGEIPANTPIMIKSDQKVDFNTATTTTFIFEDKTIVYPGVKTAGVKDDGNAEFIGFYNGQEFQGNKQLWQSAAGVWGFLKSGNKQKVGPLRAYLQLPAESTGEARIFIEEADGTTTAITAINADGEAVEANGWYNVNGVRLEGAPTQKGIYIRNGKKVIIK